VISEVGGIHPPTTKISSYVGGLSRQTAESYGGGDMYAGSEGIADPGSISTIGWGNSSKLVNADRC